MAAAVFGANKAKEKRDAKQPRTVFEKYDANGDGGIDETEFRGLLIEEGIVRPVEDEPSSTCTLL